MIETNIRILKPGENLYLDTRLIHVEGQNLSPDLLQRVCSALQRDHKQATIPYILKDKHTLLAYSTKKIKPLIKEGDDWRAEVKDGGEGPRLLFSNLKHRKFMEKLIERCFLVEIGLKTNLWILDSPRIWYEPESFQTQKDISAFRRFRISVISINSVGLGVIVNVGTAFFTNLKVSDYFINNNGDYLKKRFEYLSLRQKGQKGTLLYDLDEKKFKCYFKEFRDGVTCGETGKFRIKGYTYNSLFEYYQKKYPKIDVKRNDPVAMVSFRGLDKPQPVAANRLRLRVMNEALPLQLKNIDKISTFDRRQLIKSFWGKFDDYPLGSGRPAFERNFWCPNDKKRILVQPPSLKFSTSEQLAPPRNASTRDYKKYYQDRSLLLKKKGCLYVPSTINRKIYFAFPQKTREELEKRFSEDIIALISRWTQKDIKQEILRYPKINDAIISLRNEREPAMVVFVFEDEDPATYFNLAYELNSWRIKRITKKQLDFCFNRLEKTKHQQKGHSQKSRGEAQWNSFIKMCALDVLQQLSCIPWSILTPLNYEAQLVIDVGRDRRYFALSLFICRSKKYKPNLWIDTKVQRKPDFKYETINEIILKDSIVNIFKNAGKFNHYTPINSILVLRDGRECGQEIEGIQKAQIDLQNLKLLSQEVRLDIIDFHKQSVKEIRMWDHKSNYVTNVLEGTAIFLDRETVILTNTGSATLHQGTANPLMLYTRTKGVDMHAVTADVFSTAQLNWSSPNVAQRLPLPLKRTDDELKNRAAQEIRRIG